MLSYGFLDTCCFVQKVTRCVRGDITAVMGLYVLELCGGSVRKAGKTA